MTTTESQTQSDSESVTSSAWAWGQLEIRWGRRGRRRLASVNIRVSNFDLNSGPLPAGPGPATGSLAARAGRTSSDSESSLPTQ